MTTLPNHSLYYRPTCPYCLKVRSALTAMDIDIALVNISEDKKASDALLQEGGKTMVPCLKIDHDDGSSQWMYESDDIIDYLKSQISP